MRVLFGFVLAAVTVITSVQAFQACDSNTGCTDDYDCDQAFVCKLSTKSCEPFVCKEDADCDGSLTCNDNECK
ncbi:MAG: hypothetical protein U1F43_32580 [Myxococcota bacterium]